MTTPTVELLRSAFPSIPGYLNTASLGLPSHAGRAAIETHLADWHHGRCDPPHFDTDVERSRQAYASLVGADPSTVAVGSQVSVQVGLVASSLADGTTVLCAEEEFTSVLFPFLADARLDVRPVPLDRLLDEIESGVGAIAVSAVQSADGRRLDLGVLAERAAGVRARTVVDVTQAAGWMPLDVTPFDVTVCGGYKWLSCPRGTAFMSVAPTAHEWLVPRQAGWYAGDDPWQSIYGSPLRLASDARRFDVSPAWIAWVGAAPTLELLADADLAEVEAHDVGLANSLRGRLGLQPSNSAIVALDSEVVGSTVDPEALSAAGIRCAGRAGKVRVSFHHYNTSADVDALVDALGR